MNTDSTGHRTSPTSDGGRPTNELGFPIVDLHAHRTEGQSLTDMVQLAQERARVMAMIYVVVIVFTSPFGWIAGQISEVNRSWPFVLNAILFSAGGVLTYLIAPWVHDENPSAD